MLFELTHFERRIAVLKVDALQFKVVVHAKERFPDWCNGISLQLAAFHAIVGVMLQPRVDTLLAKQTTTFSTLLWIAHDALTEEAFELIIDLLSEPTAIKS